MGKLQEETNNPLNVRYSEKNNWLGQVGSYKGFCVFKDVFWGVRAALRCIITYMKRGKMTIRDIISTFAPPTENNTERYIQSVCSMMGVSETYTIKDWIDVLHLLQAMWWMESGSEPDNDIIGRVIGWCNPELEQAGVSTSVFFDEFKCKEDFAEAIVDLESDNLQEEKA